MQNQSENKIWLIFLLFINKKYKNRSVWDGTHWNVSKERIESIAEHVYVTCILALSIDSEFETHLDIGKVIKMLVLHELGEVVIGDITPFDNVTRKQICYGGYSMARITFFSVLKSKLKCTFCKKECPVRYMPERKQNQTYDGHRSITRCKKDQKAHEDAILKKRLP